MKQVFVDEVCSLSSRVMLNEREAHHLFDVLRIEKKESVRVVDSQSQVFLAYPDTKPFLKIYDQLQVQDTRQDITLCASLIKQDKFEWMLQKACELGVTRIVPFESRYSIVHIDPIKQEKKLARWQMILDEACKQCNRHDRVILERITTVDKLEQYSGQLNLVAYEVTKDSCFHLAHYLKVPYESITVCIGCEGGFAKEEVDHLVKAGFETCSLGTRILRAETAACFVLSSIEFARHIKRKGD